MKQKLLVSIIFLGMISLHVCAQEEETNVYDYFKKSYSDSRSTNTWYVSIGGGPNLLMANQDGEKPVFDRITYGGELSIGKWFSSIIGMRLQFHGGQYKGVNFVDTHQGEFTDPHKDDSRYPRKWILGTGTTRTDNEQIGFKFTDDGKFFFQEFTSYAAFLDLTVNITRLVRPHREPSKFNAVGFIGIGYAMNEESLTNPETDAPGVRFGGRVSYDLKKDSHWAVYFEGNGCFFEEKYDGYIGDRGYDSHANVMMGLQYKF